MVSRTLLIQKDKLWDLFIETFGAAVQLILGESGGTVLFLGAVGALAIVVLYVWLRIHNNTQPKPPFSLRQAFRNLNQLGMSTLRAIVGGNITWRNSVVSILLVVLTLWGPGSQAIASWTPVHVSCPLRGVDALNGTRLKACLLDGKQEDPVGIATMCENQEITFPSVPRSEYRLYCYRILERQPKPDLQCTDAEMVEVISNQWQVTQSNVRTPAPEGKMMTHGVIAETTLHYGSAERALDAKNRQKLDDLIDAVMKLRKNHTFIIEAHTSSAAQNGFDNPLLSHRRAHAVVVHLSKKVDRSHIIAVPLAASDLLHTDSGGLANNEYQRRVRVIAITQDPVPRGSPVAKLKLPDRDSAPTHTETAMSNQGDGILTASAGSASVP